MGGGGKTLLLPLALLVLAAAAIAIIIADLTPPASAQSEDEIAGRIVARRLASGRVEFAWQPTGSQERVLPQSRYFPAAPGHNRWLRSSPVEVGGVAIGRINARLLSDGRIEFAFTPTDGERILPPARNFPASATVARGWLRSTEITFAPPAPRYTAVSATQAHACALRSDGALECWGYNLDGETGAPAGARPEPDPDKNNRRIVYLVGTYSAVSVGDTQYTCAINESRAIVCWGDNDLGQTDAPAGSDGLAIGGFTAVSAGRAHTCGLRAGGEIEYKRGNITCWGRNTRSVWNPDTRRIDNVYTGQRDAPAGRFTAVSAGRDHTCAIRESDSAIECWGSNEHGQRDAPAGRFTAVSAGVNYSCGLRESGAIECWGDNDWGQTNAPAGRFTTISSSSAGWPHTCAIRASGELECWGDLQYWPDPQRQNKAPAGRFTAVSAGRGHTCAIRESGEIECWDHYIPRH